MFVFSLQVMEPEGAKIVRFTSGIFYGNVDGLKSGIKSIVSAFTFNF